MSEEAAVKLMYWAYMGVKGNIDHPTKFTEKLQWLKIHDHNPLYTTMVDKYAVKDYVSKKIGAQYVIPLYGVWDSFNDIVFDKLPNQFVLKTTHSSGGYVVCKDKATFDYEKARKVLTDSLKFNYYAHCREWPYKNVPRRIIAEKYMPTLGNADSEEYKITCINGKVRVFTVCRGIPHQSLDVRFNDNFDRDFNRENWWAFYKPSGKPVAKPEKFDEMIALAEKLSEGIPHVRVDFYVIDGQVYFGEMTFFTWAGFIDFHPKSQDDLMGSWLKLPNEQ